MKESGDRANKAATNNANPRSCLVSFYDCDDCDDCDESSDSTVLFMFLR